MMGLYLQPEMAERMLESRQSTPLQGMYAPASDGCVKGFVIIKLRQAPQAAPQPRRRLLLQQYPVMMLQYQHQAMALWQGFSWCLAGQGVLHGMPARVAAA